MYDVVIEGAGGLCTYGESVSIQACTFTAVDVEATGVPSVTSNLGSITITPISGTGLISTAMMADKISLIAMCLKIYLRGSII